MSSKAKIISDIKAIGEELTIKLLKDDTNTTTIDSTQCLEILQSLESVTTSSSSSSKKPSGDDAVEPVITIAILNETKIGLCLNKLVKTMRRLKRSQDKEEEGDESSSNNVWKECIELSQTLLQKWKDDVKRERENQSSIATATTASATSTGSKDGKKNDGNGKSSSTDGKLPSTTAEYRIRLITQKKEIYKDPPALPPLSIAIENEYCPLPKRNKKTGELTFVLSTNQIESSPKGSKLLEFIKDFKPNRTPEEVLRAGSFGGTYFRPIVSSVTNLRYTPSAVLNDTVKPEWISKLDKKSMLTASTYNTRINKYKVKCGGSLGMWESSGWISDSDPYGWFQWYCRFYQGRRCADDERQISRWLKSAGPKGRFRSQLCNKIFAQGGLGKINDFKISPVIRQTLLHWGLEITEDVLRKHGKRVGKL